VCSSDLVAMVNLPLSATGRIDQRITANHDAAFYDIGNQLAVIVLIVRHQDHRARRHAATRCLRGADRRVEQMERQFRRLSEQGFDTFRLVHARQLYENTVIALALLSGSVIQLWKTLGSVGTPILLLPMALAQLNRARSGRRVVWSMGVSGGTALIWLVLGGGGSWHGVEAIFPGLAVSAMILFWPHGRQKKSALPQ